jgi:tetratricopeptide (TPR) repeat protein
LAFDRDGTLKKAEKLVRQGRLDQAIAEYVRVVDDNPGDWSTANTLGELYAKAGKAAEAIEQYARIGEHFAEDGFYPKAAALYKKILKLKPNDEPAQIALADMSAKQGLLADAKSYLNQIASRRKARGDSRGAAEMIVKLGDVDPADFDARLAGARMLEQMGEDDKASQRFKGLHDDLLEKGRAAEALEMLKEFVRLNPLESSARASLAKSAMASGDIAGAREFLDEHSAGDDPSLLLALVEIELRSGELQHARDLSRRLLGIDPTRRSALLEIGWPYVASSPDTTFMCVDAVVDSAMSAQAFEEAAGALQAFVNRVPGQIPALLKLVEVCVDGGFESAMYEAQERLTDAYLASNQPAEARAIAEDLVAREPWEAAHIDRFRRALVMLRVSDPDTLIAERLSGQAPFMAHDPFFDPPPPDDVPGLEETVSPAPVPAEAAAGTPTDEAITGDDPLEIPEDAEEPATPPAPARMIVVPTSQSAEEIDLTGALDGGAPAAPTKNLDQVFSEIREEAGDDQDFSAQHMTLARTYLEIGMLDEALASLQTAVRSPRQRFEAASALGRLYVRRGEPAAAIEWFERAAEAPAPTPDEGRALLYDLGVLLDEAAETSRALAVFLELQADAGDYRDVPSRIDRLARVQTGG